MCFLENQMVKTGTLHAFTRNDWHSTCMTIRCFFHVDDARQATTMNQY